jgi:hypothetical protein
LVKEDATVPDGVQGETAPVLHVTPSSPAPLGKNLFEGGAEDLVKGIILAEVLGKPLSRRKRH